MGSHALVMYPSLGSARFGSVLARAFGQKARLGSARSISQKARFGKIHENEPIQEVEKNFFVDSFCNFVKYCPIFKIEVSLES